MGQTSLFIMRLWITGISKLMLKRQRKKSCELKVNQLTTMRYFCK